MKKLLSVLLALTLATTLFACGQKQATNTTAENTPAATDAPQVFKVGGIGPITGGAAVYGQAVQNGIKIAIDEINANALAA